MDLAARARAVTVAPASRIRGVLRVPGDKSISHRYALLASLADGHSTIDGYAPGGDCASTLRCLEALGVRVTRSTQDGRPVVRIEGRGRSGLTPPAQPLDCGNSGSTMRMLAGVLAGQAFTSTLIGDQSLTRRPMHRVMAPLAQMGARLTAAGGDRPPLTIAGGALHGIEWQTPVPSAQVKSAVLLAGLQARGRTRVIEAVQTRDHTERALVAFGVAVDRDDRGGVAVEGGQRLTGRALQVPGDISSAAFAMAAAAACEGSEVVIEDVGLNPTRTALLGVLRQFGAEVDAEVSGDWHGEAVGRIRLAGRGLGSLRLGADIVPLIIDELPVLGALATAGGELHVTGASELRVKESDRIAALVQGLRALGADAEELSDGFHIRGRRLTGGRVHAHDDHRLAMAFAIAALGADGPVTIDGADAAAVSYPSFFDDLDRLRA